MPLFIRGNVLRVRPSHHRSGINRSLIGRTGWHDAVRRVENRTGKVIKLLLLILPGGTVVALERSILLQLRIGVRR